MQLLKHSIFYYLLCFLHFFLGVNGLIGGTLLLLKKDGSLLRMEQGWLQHSPFPNYLIPGLFLFLFLGILPLVTVGGLIKKNSFQKLNLFNIYSDKYWAWTFSLYTGIVSIAWIIIQLILTDYFWLQPVILSVGLLIIICTMVPAILKQFTITFTHQQ